MIGLTLCRISLADAADSFWQEPVMLAFGAALLLTAVICLYLGYKLGHCFPKKVKCERCSDYKKKLEEAHGLAQFVLRRQHLTVGPYDDTVTPSEEVRPAIRENWGKDAQAKAWRKVTETLVSSFPVLREKEVVVTKWGLTDSNTYHTSRCATVVASKGFKTFRLCSHCNGAARTSESSNTERTIESSAPIFGTRYPDFPYTGPEYAYLANQLPRSIVTHIPSEVD